MKLTLKRLLDRDGATLGALFVDNKLQCFTLEDEYRDKKVPGETRIPAGTYRIGQRGYGRFFETYHQRWGHLFVPEVEGVVGFTDILIHTGNTEEHTAGCILVGERAELEGQPTIGGSWPAYKALYKKMAGAYRNRESITLEILDTDRIDRS